MPYLKTESNFKSTRNVFKRKSKGETISDESLLRAAREIKKLDPSFMPSVKAQTRKLSPQKRGALLKGLSERRETLTNQLKGRDVYQPPKKKGETKLAYTRRVKKIQRANNQGDNKGLYVTVQNQETALGKKPRVIFDDKNRIQTVYDDGRFEARSVFIPASHLQNQEILEKAREEDSIPLPTFETVEADFLEAFAEGSTWKVPPDQVAVAIWGTRLTADSGLAFSWTDVLTRGRFDPDKAQDIASEKAALFGEDIFPDMLEAIEEMRDEDPVEDPAAKGYAKKRAEGYDGIWVEFSGEKEL